MHVLDVLMTNESESADMVDITRTLHNYLGSNYPSNQRILSWGDQLTRERQTASQKHVMCGNTPEERLEFIEAAVEDWHCMVTFTLVRLYALSC